MVNSRSNLEFWQIDAFSVEPFKGNPAAVVFDADGLDAERMQMIARQMNLSETVFFLKPSNSEADYAVRIFTPRSEVPFAGHPTIAAAYAFCKRELPVNAFPDKLTQQCEAGLVPVECSVRDDNWVFTMTQRPPQYRDVDVDRQRAADMLGLDPEDIEDRPIQICSTGVDWMIVPVASLAAHASADPDLTLIEKVCREQKAVGVTSFSWLVKSPEASVHLRTFAPGEGIAEDPVCGSGNGSVGAYIANHVRPGEESFTYVAEQGHEVARDGRIWVEVKGNGSENMIVRVGGQAAKVMEGRIFI